MAQAEQSDIAHSLVRPLLWAAAVMLVLAIPPIWPYGYYTFLRLVVGGVCIYSVVCLPRTSVGSTIFLVLIALLFNPFVPVYLTKAIWIPIDIGVAIFLFVLGMRSTSERKSTIELSRETDNPQRNN